MRELDILYDNKISGTYPNFQAIDSSTETSFDGSPSLALNINDLTIGPLQALFTLLGISIFNGQPEVKDNSEILDAWRQMAQYKTVETITSGGTLTLGNFSKVFIIDTSLGDLSNIMPDGVFDGQEFEVICDGTGISAIIGSGPLVNRRRSGIWDAVDTTGTKITDGLSLKARWNILLSKWQVVNEITADYTSGVGIYKQYPNGDLIIDFGTTITFSASSTASVSLVWALPLLTANYYTNSMVDDVISTFVVQYAIGSRTSVGVILRYVTTDGSSVSGTENIKGSTGFVKY